MVALSNVTEYLYSSSKSGMRISIHKQNFEPFPNTEGYSTAVGTAVSISIRYVSNTLATVEFPIYSKKIVKL